MSVTSIQRDPQNNVTLVRMTVTDDLATVGSANYILFQMNNIRNLNQGTWDWFSSDMILCAANDGNALFTFTDDTFSTLVQYGTAGSGTVNPGLINQLAFYETSGDTVNGLPTAGNGVLITDVSGVPSISTSLPFGLNIPGYLKLSGGTMTGALSMGGYQINNLVDPITGQDATTKSWVLANTLSLNLNQSLAAGTGSSVGTATNSFAFGNTVIASGNDSWAGGHNGTTASGDNSFAFGFGGGATGQHSVMFGSSLSEGSYTFSLGNNCNTDVCTGGTTWGRDCYTNGDFSFVYGYDNYFTPGTVSSYAFVFGSGHGGNGNAGLYSFSFGQQNNFNLNSGAYSLSFGLGNRALGSHSKAIGNTAIANNNGSTVWNDGTVLSTDTGPNQFQLTFHGGYFFNAGNVNISSPGFGLAINETANGKQGKVTLSGGVGVVSNTSLTSGSNIFYCGQDANVTGFLRISSRTNGSGFTITSSVGTDHGVVSWIITEPA